MAYFNSEKQNRAEFKMPQRVSLYYGAVSQWVVMGSAVLLGLIVTPVIIRTLGNESYGLWGLVASFVGFYGLFDFGLSQAISRFLGNAIGAKDIREFNRVASTGKCLLCTASLLVIIFALVIMKPAQSILRIPEEYASEFHLLVIFSAASIAVSMVAAIYGGALRASEDFVFLSGIQLCANFVRSLGGLWAVLAGMGVVGLAVVAMVSTILQQCVVFLRCRKRLPQMKASFLSFDTVMARSLIGFGGAAFVVIVAEIVRSKLDVMLVTRFGGLNQAGLYAVALVVFGYFFRAVIAVAGVTWPRLNTLYGKGNLVELQTFFQRASHITAVYASMLSGFLIGLAPLLIRLWVGDGYEKSSIVVQILIGGYFLDIATNPAIGSLYATAHHRYFAAQTAVEAVASFTLAFILGSKYGMNGVAIGIVIPITVVKLTIQPWYVARNLSISLREYWFRVILMATLAMCILAGGLVSLSYTVGQWNIWAGLSIVALAVIVSAVVLWRFVLDKADRASIVWRIKRISYRIISLKDRISVLLNL